MIDWHQRAQDMHRRAQKAEGRLERAMWWIDAGLTKRKTAFPKDMPEWMVNRFYLEEAKRAAERETSPGRACTTAAPGRNTMPPLCGD